MLEYGKDIHIIYFHSKRHRETKETHSSHRTIVILKFREQDPGNCPFLRGSGDSMNWFYSSERSILLIAPQDLELFSWKVFWVLIPPRIHLVFF